MRLSRIIPVMLPLAAFVLLPACKPTEKNYREAYDVARHKKTKLTEDPDLDLTGLIADGDPSVQSVAGVDVRVMSIPLKTVFSGHSPMRYNLVVGRYKMRANALSHAERLTAEGADAFVAEDKEEKLYVVYGGYDSPKEIAAKIRSMRENHPDAFYPGLDEGPVVIINTLVP